LPRHSRRAFDIAALDRDLGDGTLVLSRGSGSGSGQTRTERRSGPDGGRQYLAGEPAPFDKNQDVFFGYHERSFSKAYAFDLAMLESLGMRRATIAYEGWPAPLEVEGPLLREVLAAAGAAGGTVAMLALDGFAAELSPGELAAEDWMVVIKENGQYLGIGGRGPAWVLYPRRDGKMATAADEQRWPWAVFLIEVR